MEQDNFKKTANSDAYVRMLLFDAQLLVLLIKKGLTTDTHTFKRDYAEISNENVNLAMEVIVARFNNMTRSEDFSEII